MADTKSEQGRGLQQSELSPDTRTGSQPTHLDLFSGIGGFALAAQWAGFRTIGFCEIDKYCQKVLAKNFLANTRQPLLTGSVKRETNGVEVGEQYANQSERSDSPRIFSDIFKLDGTQFRGVSLVTGGFPCQPFSVAGKRGGAGDDRAIWPQMFRVIKEARPTWVLGENVSGIIPMELDNVLSDLEGIGYATRAFVIPACAVDARHRRDRVWIIGRFMGDSANIRSEVGHIEHEQRSQGHGRLRECAGQWSARESGSAEYCRWQPEPDVGRVAHGIPNRIHRLKGLGNAIVPQVAYEILREIRKLI